MVRRILAVFVLVSLVMGLTYAQTKETPKDDGTKREQFDPKKDSEKDLKDAVALATKSHQRIVLDVGGEWCIWCRRLDKFFQDNVDVSEFLHSNFIVVKINYSEENKNEKFLSKYPEIEGFPHLFVLDSEGKFLHSQDTGALESGDHHDHDKVLTFLKKWAPKWTRKASGNGKIPGRKIES